MGWSTDGELAPLKCNQVQQKRAKVIKEPFLFIHASHSLKKSVKKVVDECFTIHP